jgi:hypothetical protein
VRVDDYVALLIPGGCSLDHLRIEDDLAAFGGGILQQLGHGAAARQGATEAGAHP